MIKSILIALVLAVAAVLLYAATKPDRFRIERSVVVNAPPERIHVLVHDFKAWTAWSPWERIDPALKRSYGGAQSGKGATYAWEGNKDVGSGRMEIVESAVPSKIVIKLDFFAPFEAHNVAEFTFTPVGQGTTVQWAMHGPSPYLSKLLDLVFNMDRMVGGQFETGLSNLKAIAEK
ncbi:MAG: SRPBCC family protein [Betaproteobacteria bacterium]